MCCPATDFEDAPVGVERMTEPRQGTQPSRDGWRWVGLVEIG